MKYEIWNKVDDIKGQNAQYWLIQNPEFNEGDVIIIKNELDIVTRVESVFTLASNYKIDTSLSTDEIISEYIRIKQLEEEKSNQDNVSLEEAHDKISILEEENKKLKEVTKDQDNLLVDNAYKITMLEMNLGGK